MKKIFIAFSLVSSLALAESVQPSPVDSKGKTEDIHGAIVEPTPEQKASVQPPQAPIKAKKKKKSRKANK